MQAYTQHMDGFQFCLNHVVRAIVPGYSPDETIQQWLAILGLLAAPPRTRINQLDRYFTSAQSCQRFWGLPHPSRGGTHQAGQTLTSASLGRRHRGPFRRPTIAMIDILPMTKGKASATQVIALSGLNVPGHARRYL